MGIGRIAATSVCVTTCLAGTGSSLAERTQGTLLVSATVVSTCSSTSVVTTLPDGTFVPQVTVDCGAATPYQVSVDSTSAVLTASATSGGGPAGGPITVTVDF